MKMAIATRAIPAIANPIAITANPRAYVSIALALHNSTDPFGP
jgi:hypothetical protein